MRRTVVACQPSSLSRSANLEADLATRLDGVELALDHAVAMEVDLALRGLDKAEAALAVDHTHRTVQRELTFTLPLWARMWSRPRRSWR